MKNRKIEYQKFVLSLLATSIGFSSCSQYGMDENCFTMDNFAEDSDEGVNLLPFEIYIGEEYKELIHFTNAFVTHILSDEQEAIAFRDNPKVILEKHNLDDIDVDVKSPEIQIIFALADNDVLSAIQEGDVKRYLKLLVEKDLLQTEKFKRMMSLIDGTYPNTRTQEELAIPPVFICALGVLIYGAVATVYDFVVVAHYDLAIYSASENDLSNMMYDEVTDTTVVNLWKAKSKNEHMYDLSNAVNNSIAELVMDLSEILELSDEEQTKVLMLSQNVVYKIDKK